MLTSVVLLILEQLLQIMLTVHVLVVSFKTLLMVTAGRTIVMLLITCSMIGTLLLVKTTEILVFFVNKLVE
jgi:hypothetical protein